MADLANAVIAYNAGFEAGDQVTFFYGQQTTDAVTGIPRARIYGFKVMLNRRTSERRGQACLDYPERGGGNAKRNPGDSTPLYEVVSEIGFSSVDGKLGMSQSITDGAAVWVHSREDGTSGLKVSTQFLFVDSSVLAGYQGSQAMAASANSYGGINTSAVYLNPRSGAGSGAGSVVVNPVTPSGGGSSNQNENENQNQGGGSSETPSGGGQTGGSDTGGTTGGNTGGGDNPGGNTGGDNTGGGEDEPGGDDH